MLSRQISEPIAAPAVELGPFRLEAPIGHGGMGVVWSATHRSQGLPVAVKVLSGDRARQPSAVAAFRREVLAVARLSHAGIVQVLDYGQIPADIAADSRLEPGSPYLVMELASGGTLAERRGRARWPEVRGILLAMLDALAHAHARGVLHRDIKPSNVLHGGQPRAYKLADFGLAAPGEGGPGEARARCGTPAYMAPEQVRGDWRSFGPWTDLYALGCFTCALLDGRSPFVRERVSATWRAHLEPAPFPLRHRAPVPPGLDAWLARMMAVEPRDRFQRAADAAAALRALGPAPTAAPAPAPPSGRAAHSSEDSWQPLFSDSASLSGRAAPLLESRRPAPTAPTAALPLLPVHSPPAHWRGPQDQRRPLHLEGTGLGLFGLRSGALAGRDSQRDHLWRVLVEVAQERSPRAVVLRGPAGVGKSQLARWLGERAHELGLAHLMRARHSNPVGAEDGLVSMLNRTLRCGGLERHEVAERVSERLPRATPRQVGALTELLHPLEPGALTRGVTPVDLGSPGARRSALEDYLRLRADRRLIIVWLDDVQWGAEAIAWCQQVLESDIPALFVLTAREEALSEQPQESAALTGLMAQPAVTGCPVPPLSPEAQRSLVRDLLGLAPEVAEAVTARAGGIPLFAIQLVGDWVQRGVLVPGPDGFVPAPGADLQVPDAIHELWMGRVGHLLSALTPGDQQALELAAVLGVRVEQREWAAACDIARVSLSDALSEALQRQGLAASTSTGLTFIHGMLTESLVRAAREQGRLSSSQAAAGKALYRLGGALVSQSSHEAERMFSRAVALLDPEEHGSDWAQARFRASSYQTRLGRVEESRAGLAEALEVARRVSDVRLEIRILRSLAAHSQELGDLDASLRLHDEALRKARVAGDEEGEALLLDSLSSVQRELGRFDEARASATFAAERLHGLGLRFAEANALSTLGLISHEQGSFEEARAQFQRALALAREGGSLRDEAIYSANLGLVLSDMGELSLARGHYEDALTLYLQLGARRPEAITRANLGSLLRQLGDFAGARRSYEQALVIHQEMQSRRSEAIVMSNLGNLLSQRGDYESAITYIESAEAILGAISSPMHRSSVRINLASALRQVGQLDRSERLLSTVLRYYQTVGRRLYRGWAIMGFGELRRQQGRLAEAEQLLLESLTLFQDLGDGCSEEVARTELAALRLLQGRPAEGLTLLKPALAFNRAKRRSQRLGIQLGLESELYEALDQHDRALTAAREGATLTRDSGELKAGVLLARLGRLMAARGLTEESRRLIREGEARYQTRTIYRGMVLCDQARAEHLLGDTAAAAAALEEAVAIAAALRCAPLSTLGQAITSARAAL